MAPRKNNTKYRVNVKRRTIDLVQLTPEEVKNLGQINSMGQIFLNATTFSAGGVLASLIEFISAEWKPSIAIWGVMICSVILTFVFFGTFLLCLKGYNKEKRKN